MGSAVPVATFDHCKPLGVVPEKIVGWTKTAAWAARPERRRARRRSRERGAGTVEIGEDFMAAGGWDEVLSFKKHRAGRFAQQMEVGS